MPHTVNGIGTWYWGKANQYVRHGECPMCRKYAQLTSYDTTLFVVVLFIPVIPIGKKRVLEQCSKCRRHRVLPLSKWIDAQLTDISQTAADANANPRDENKAAVALGTAIGYRAQQEFELLARQFAQALPRSALVQAVIGDGYRAFANHEQATLAFAKSLALQDDPKVRVALAVQQIRDRRTADAEKTVTPLLSSADPAMQGQNQGLMYALVEGYQAEGDHERALSWLQEIESKNPAAAQDKAHQRARKQSEKLRGTGRAVGTSMAQEAPRPVRTGGWRSRAPVLIFPAIIIIAAIGWLLSCLYIGQSRRVFLVSGLDRASKVQVGGKTFTLAPFEHRAVRLPEGDHPIRMIEPASAITSSASIHTSFLNRPIDNRTFVVNPDGTALLTWEETEYVEHPNPNDSSPHRLLAGERIYEFDDIDYPFEQLPQTLKLNSDRTKNTRRQVMNVPGVRPVVVAQALLKESGKEMVARYLRSAVQANPRDQMLLALAMQFVDPADMIAVLQPLLSERPAIIPVHRTYQEIIERTDPAHDLAKEYAAFLAKEPGNAQLAYLAGRVQNDNRDEARRLFTLATGAGINSGGSNSGSSNSGGGNPGGEPYANHALAYDAFNEADFATAVTLERKALNADPQNFDFVTSLVPYLSAAGQYSEAAAIVHEHAKQAEMDPSDEMYFLYRAGDISGAKRCADGLVAQSGAPGSDSAKRTRDILDGIFRYLEGNIPEYSHLLARQGDDAKFALALCEGRIADAEAQRLAALSQAAPSNTNPPMLIYVAAKAVGDEKTARSALDGLISAARNGSHDSKRLAEILASQQPVKWDEVKMLQDSPDSHGLLLTTLGLRFPEIREQCFKEAEKFDFDLRFPHHLAKAAREKK